jgi:hypothetical protein
MRTPGRQAHPGKPDQQHIEASSTRQKFPPETGKLNSHHSQQCFENISNTLDLSMAQNCDPRHTCAEGRVDPTWALVDSYCPKYASNFQSTLWFVQ